MKKRFSRSAVSLLTLAAVLGAWLLCNLGLDRLSEKADLTLDLSSDHLTALGDETTQVLSGLSQPVTFTIVHKTGAADELYPLLTTLLSKYQASSDLITVETVDPAQEPERIAALNGSGQATPDNTVFVHTPGGSVRRLEADGFRYQKTLDGTLYALFAGEPRFTGAILNVTRQQLTRALLLSGHGETALADCSTFALLLSSLGLGTDTLEIGVGALSPDDLLIIADPQTDLTRTEEETLKAFVDAGGKLLMACGAKTPWDALPRFQALLDLYGLGFLSGTTVCDPADATGFVERADLVRGLSADGTEAGRVVLPESCAIAPAALRPDVTATALLETVKSAWRKPFGSTDLYAFAPGDATGRQTLALRAAGGENGFGILLLASAAMLRDDATLGALDLGSATDDLAWLSAQLQALLGTEEIIAAADLKTLPTNVLLFDSQADKQRVQVLAVAALPCLIAVLAVVVLAIRRRRTC